MNIIKHKCYKYRDNDDDDRSSDIGLVKKQYDTKDKKNDGHQSSSESVQSIYNVYRIDDRDSSEEGKYRIKYPERNLACDRPQIDIIYPQSTIKPPTNKRRKNYHTYQLCFGAQSFYLTISSDIQKIINESY